MKPRKTALIKVFPLMALGLSLLFSCSTSSFFYAPYKDYRTCSDTNGYNINKISFRSADNMLLTGWLMKPKNGKIIGTVLHFHGNAGNISYHYPFLLPLVSAGFQCVIWDYEQFGFSEGKASQEHVLEDGLAALEYTRSLPGVKEQKLILFGQSLGAHLAIVVAAQKQDELSGLVVEGAFTGHKDIASFVGWHHFLAPPFITRMLIPSRYDALKVVDKISIPKLFIHSREDEVCPFFMGQQLYEKATAPKEFWEIKGRHIYSALLYKDEFVAHFLKMIQ